IVFFEGEAVEDTRPSKRTVRGIARTFQNIRLFPHLTVVETVMIGEHCRAYPSVWKAFGKGVLWRARGEEREMRANAIELLEFLGLADRQDAKASDLPY